MSKWMIGGIGCAGVGAVFLLVLFLYGFSVVRKEASLRVTVENKQVDNTSEFDNMWKKISQVAQVTNAQKEALKEIFVEHAKARTGDGGGGSIMKWVQESVPNVDVKVYQQLIGIITVSRDSFTMRQKELVDLKREHDLLIEVPPASMVSWIMGLKKVDIVIVTSGKTRDSFKTGEDNDVGIFQK